MAASTASRGVLNAPGLCLPANSLNFPLAIGQRIRLGASAPARSAGKVTAAKVHVVRRGETLSAVARRYGVSVQRLMEANGLVRGNSIRAGARLKVPA